MDANGAFVIADEDGQAVESIYQLVEFIEGIFGCGKTLIQSIRSSPNIQSCCESNRINTSVIVGNTDFRLVQSIVDINHSASLRPKLSRLYCALVIVYNFFPFARQHLTTGLVHRLTVHFSIVT